MLLADNMVIFKSIPLFYERERDGEKPNTTRILNVEDWDALVNNYPRRIRIVSKFDRTKHLFERKITNISKLWQMFDKVVITISWQHVTEEAAARNGGSAR